ncbi:hypothetical protein CHS0354_030424 [Potamilus streckersoni]|uniref:RUS family member 1 n=1 Tax=Potamilus streckersoni TaxID=2493646 RepID=A0AAE0VS91_9BIVA|nr:hypothetical protein CHS0354_030424 [Potamilus streckersoni]
MTWLVKDGTGMLGRILFAWFQGSNLDCDAKRWRLFADVLNDLAIFIEILAPNFPPFFTFMICTAGTFKSIVGVAGGATRAALTQHQARRNNMADVSAKDGSQETVVNLAALLCNLVLIPLVTGKVWLIWTLYIVFTILHLFANYSAVTCVIMETFNKARFHILLQEYFGSNNVLPPAPVNFREPVLWATRRKLQINLGSSLQSKCKSIEDVKILQDVFEGSQYLLGVDFKKRKVHIVLHKNCTIEDQLNACYQAELVEYAWLHITSLSQVQITELQLLVQAIKEENMRDVLAISYQYARKTFLDVKSAMESMGWRTDIALLGADEWRAEWDFTTGLSDKKEM